MTLISRFLAKIKSDRCQRWTVALLFGLMVPGVQATQTNEAWLSNTTQKCAVCQRYEDMVSKLEGVAIRVDPGLDPAYAQMRKHRVVPLDLGYAFIGKATIHEYQQAWERFFKARAAHLKLMGESITQPCNLLVTESGLTIHSPSCLPVIGFERVDAKFDEHGILSSILLVLNLNDETVQDQLRQLLQLRYPLIDPPRTPLAKVAKYIGELNRLMVELSRNQYHADTSWHQAGDNYAYVKFSGYAGHEKVMMLFGSEHYFTHDEMFLVKRRLAIVRQELAQLQRRLPTTMVSQTPSSAQPPITAPTPKSLTTPRPEPVNASRLEANSAPHLEANSAPRLEANSAPRLEAALTQHANPTFPELSSNPAPTTSVAAAH